MAGDDDAEEEEKHSVTKGNTKQLAEKDNDDEELAFEE